VFTASSAKSDRENDVIQPEGWVLEHFKDGGPLLWGHDQSKLPIGRILWVKVDDGKLVGKAKFNGQTQLSTDVEKLVRSGDLTALSVGFRPLDMKMNNEGGRNFTKQELLEISVVNVPANPDAVIHSIKSMDIKSTSLIKAIMENKEEKETVDECIDRKIPIIMEENPTMEEDQAYAIAREMCMESTVTDSTEGECKGCGCNQAKEEEKEKGDCPMDNPECSNYQKNQYGITMDEMVMEFGNTQERLERLEDQYSRAKKRIEELEKKDAEEEVEIDLREKKLELLRRAVSNYLARKKSNMEDI